jgi:hypothetical protein
MCRYAFHNYRDHFACFDCRKSFKYWQWEELDQAFFHRKQKRGHVPREIVCPECTKPMVDMGLDFKAPPKSNKAAWEILQALFEHGFAFHSCGCGGPGFKPPRTLREVPEWIKRHGRRSEGEKLSQKFVDRGEH